MKLGRTGAEAVLPPHFFVMNALVAGLLMPAVSALADDDWQSAGNEVETVQVTATRTRAAIEDVAAAVSAVSADEIQAANPGVLPEMLRGVPGAFFQQTTPGQGIPIIRGLKGSQVLHLVDGMRVNNAFFRDAPNQYIGLIDAFAIDRIEVVRGASGSLYGADAMGGVVNFLTPTLAFDSPQWQTEQQLYAGWNSADHALVGRATTEGGSHGRGFTAGVTWQQHGDRRTAGAGTIRPSAYRSQAADFKIITPIGAAAEFSLSAQVLEQADTPRTDELVAGFGQSQPASAVFAFAPNRRSFVHARVDGTLDSSWIQKYQINLSRQNITDDRQTRDRGETALRTENNSSRLNGLNLQFDSDTANGSHWTWGLEVYADTINSARRETDITSGENAPVRSRFPDGSSMDSESLFAAAEWHSGERWTWLGGLRYSQFDIHLAASEDQAGAQLHPNDFSGDLRFVYEIKPGLNWVGNLGRGFRPPNIFDLGTLGNRPGNRFNTANPGLKPEFVWSYDLGIKTNRGRLRSELFVFYTDYQDKIGSVATGALTESGRVVVRSENLAEATLYGVEAGFQWAWDDSRSLYGTLNYTRGEEIADAGRQAADRIPPINGRLGLKWEPDTRLKLNAWMQFASAQHRLSPRDVDDPRINPLGTPGWISANLSVRWLFNDMLEAGFRLENLGDVAYREHGSGIDAPGRSMGIWLNQRF